MNKLMVDDIIVFTIFGTTVIGAVMLVIFAFVTIWRI